MSELMSAIAAQGLTLRERLKMTQPLVVAHRGDWREHPENSRAAISAAGAFDMVEIDVRLSADEVPFVMHDESLLRTAGREELVGDLPAHELAEIPLLHSSETIPSLADALAASQPSLFYDVDIKNARELDSVAAYLAVSGDAHRVMVKQDVTDQESQDNLMALEARHGIPVAAKVHLEDNQDLRLIEALYEAGAALAEVSFSHFELVSAACASGLPISVYTLDEIACDGFSDAAGREYPDAIWGRLANTGVRLLMTDAPEAVKATLRDT
ncbi:MAG: glycerophosphodiester phosphodiesterase family protein [Pseudomonadota bacterium]